MSLLGSDLSRHDRKWRERERAGKRQATKFTGWFFHQGCSWVIVSAQKNKMSKNILKNNLKFVKYWHFHNTRCSMFMISDTCLSSLRFQASAHCSFPAQSSESSCKHILRQPNCSAHRGQHPIAHPALSPPAGPPWKRHRWELTAQRRLKVIFGPNRALCGCICDEHNRYETVRKNVRLFFYQFLWFTSSLLALPLSHSQSVSLSPCCLSQTD